jgi:hypothetical protein
VTADPCSVAEGTAPVAVTEATARNLTVPDQLRPRLVTGCHSADRAGLARRVTGLHKQLDRRALRPVDLHIHKRRIAPDIKTRRSQVTSGDRDGFDGLVEGSRADGLYLGTV